MLGPGNAPVEGIGSALNLAFLVLGPFVLIAFFASSSARGVGGGAIVLWISQGRARWVAWAVGGAVVGLIALLTLLPVARGEIAKRQDAEDLKVILRADLEGVLGGHQVIFPTSPRLSISDDCGLEEPTEDFGCSTGFKYPDTILTGRDETLLELRDLINISCISVSPVEAGCRVRDYCLTQEKIDLWCSEIRPDQANSIWCRDIPPMWFSFRTDVTLGPRQRDEPKLATHFANTPLGPGRVKCSYNPDTTKINEQGARCSLSFEVAVGFHASLSLRRTKIMSVDPNVTATISLIPEYWAALTTER